MSDPAIEDALHQLDKSVFAGAVAAATAAERERCAKIADQVASNAERPMAGNTNREAIASAHDKMDTARQIAEAIRERSAV